jgi:16S rRNA (cytosine967-C5)-methyltransferase
MTARRAAYNALTATDRGAYANLALGEALKDVRDEEKPFAAALFYTTLDHLMTIDYAIASLCEKNAQYAVHCVLRLGICQLLYMDVPPSAACNETVKLAKELGKGGAAGFINAVLRNIAKNGRPALPVQKHPETLCVKYSFPLWLVERFVGRFGYDEAESLLAYESDNALWCGPTRRNRAISPRNSPRAVWKRAGANMKKRRCTSRG